MREEHDTDNYATCEATTCVRAHTTRRDARDTRARRTITLDALASTMRPAHKEAQSEAKSLLSRRERRVEQRTGGFSGWTEPSVYGSQSGKWRTQGNHARIPSLKASCTFCILMRTLARPRAIRVSFLGCLVSLSFSEFRFEFGSNTAWGCSPSPFSGTCWKTGNASNVNFLKTVVFAISDLAESMNG